MNAYNVDIDSLFDKKLNDVLFEAGITSEMLTNKSHKRKVTEVRQVVMAFAHMQFKLTALAAGKLYGKDHSTVIYCKKAIESEIDLLQKFPNILPSSRLQLYRKLVNIKNL